MGPSKLANPLATLWKEWASTNPEAIEQESPEWLAAVAEALQRPVEKHMGPGPHPSGSSQDVHGRKGGQSGVKIAFVTEHGEILKELQGRFGDDMRAALNKFEAMFPGALPSRVEVDVAGGFPLIFEPETFAYVNSRTYPARVYININYPVNDYIESARREPHRLAPFKIAERGDISRDVLEERMLFHELAHVAANKQFDRRGNTPPDWPRYNSTWYPQTTPPDSPSLPSEYATQSDAEFFAEALTDYAYNQPHATISQTVAQRFREVLK